MFFLLFSDVDVPTCKDVRNDCADKKFFCEYYKDYMYDYCRNFCGFCHMSKDGKLFKI